VHVDNVELGGAARVRADAESSLDQARALPETASANAANSASDAMRNETFMSAEPDGAADCSVAPRRRASSRYLRVLVLLVVPRPPPLTPATPVTAAPPSVPISSSSSPLAPGLRRP
jgi:hypothetical protein